MHGAKSECQISISAMAVGTSKIRFNIFNYWNLPEKDSQQILDQKHRSEIWSLLGYLGPIASRLHGYKDQR
jgi:hypothetical protein